MIQQNGPRVPHLPRASHVPQVWLLLNSFFKAFSNHRALKSKLLRWCFFLDTLCRKWYVFCFQNCSYPLWEKIFVIEWSVVSICHQLFNFIQICYVWPYWVDPVPVSKTDIGNSAFIGTIDVWYNETFHVPKSMNSDISSVIIISQIKKCWKVLTTQIKVFCSIFDFIIKLLHSNTYPDLQGCSIK